MVEKEGIVDEEEVCCVYCVVREDSDRVVEEVFGLKVLFVFISWIDVMFYKLEKDLDDVDVKIGDRWKILDRDFDGKVILEEVVIVVMFLKDIFG